jgi:hypothetical protein
MNEYLKVVFDTIRFYTPWSIFENFVRFFLFWILIQILNLDRLGTDRNRSGPVPTVSEPVPTCELTLLLTRDFVVYGEDKTDSVSEGPTPRYIYKQRQRLKHTLYESTSSLHPLGCASWYTHYGSVRKQTYSNQPIILFLEQDGRRFNWRPSGVGVPRCYARFVWAPGDQKLHIYDFVRPLWSVCLLLRSLIHLGSMDG